jgi:hypothetical protein
MIQANCRQLFTAADFDFIFETLAKDAKNKIPLSQLLIDAETRDEILDHEVLFQKLIQKTGFKKISAHLYFYILTRRVFSEFNIADRELADYVACLLAEFCNLNRVHSISEYPEKSYYYLTDMMSDFPETSSQEAFLIRSHIGNYALFLTGIFPDYIYRRATYGRKAPGFDYYEKMGSSSYKWASQHQLAKKYRLGEILTELADRFRLFRVALNKLTDQYLAWNEQPEKMDKMLRQIFFGNVSEQNFEA